MKKLYKYLLNKQSEYNVFKLLLNYYHNIILYYILARKHIGSRSPKSDVQQFLALSLHLPRPQGSRTYPALVFVCASRGLCLLCLFRPRRRERRSPERVCAFWVVCSFFRCVVRALVVPVAGLLALKYLEVVKGPWPVHQVLYIYKGRNMRRTLTARTPR